MKLGEGACGVPTAHGSQSSVPRGAGGGSNQRGNWGVKRDENERSGMEPAPPLLKSFGEVLMKP